MMEKVLKHIIDVSQGYIVWYIVTNISEECVASFSKPYIPRHPHRL